MTILISTIIIVIQFVAGQLLGFGVANALGVGSGWELVVIAIGNSIGIWGVGALAAVLRNSFTAGSFRIKLFGTLIGSVLGVVLILLTPATGMAQLLYPLIGGLLGYYLVPSPAVNQT